MIIQFKVSPAARSSCLCATALPVSSSELESDRLGHGIELASTGLAWRFASPYLTAPLPHVGRQLLRRWGSADAY